MDSLQAEESKSPFYQQKFSGTKQKQPVRCGLLQRPVLWTALFEQGVPQHEISVLQRVFYGQPGEIVAKSPPQAVCDEAAFSTYGYLCAGWTKAMGLRDAKIFFYHGSDAESIYELKNTDQYEVWSPFWDENIYVLACLSLGCAELSPNRYTV